MGLPINLQLFILLFWTVSGGMLGALFHHHKGHSAVSGFIGGALLGPVFVWLMLLVSAPPKCPECAEVVKSEARRCKHCGAALAAE